MVFVAGADREFVPFAAADPVAKDIVFQAALAEDHNANGLDASELSKFFKSLGFDVTEEQAKFLIKVYGNGSEVSLDSIIEVMTRDGFIVGQPNDAGGVAWSLNWDDIDGELISAAIFREVGVEPDGYATLDAKQFNDGVDKLFGDTKAQSLDQADFQIKMYGSDGRISVLQMAGIWDSVGIHRDGVAGEKYVRLFVNARELDPNDPGAVGNYLLSFDENHDGFLNATEFRKALDSDLADGVAPNDDLIDQYMRYYGFRDINGDFQLSGFSLIAMLQDTSLGVTPNADGSTGFNINLNITPIEAVVRGASLYDEGSLGDGLMSAEELKQLFKELGLGDYSTEQMQFLIKVYGDGTYVSTDTVLGLMRDDGFLTTGPRLGDPAALNWDAIDGKLISRAVFREMGVDPNAPGASLDAAQFNEGVDKLFGDTKAQSIEQAQFQVRYYGEGNRITVDQMAVIWDTVGMHRDGVAGESYVRLFVNDKNKNFQDQDQVVRFLMSFDIDGNGVLDSKELETALASMKHGGATINGQMIERLGKIYGEKADSGYTFTPETLSAMLGDGVIQTAPLKEGSSEWGFTVVLDAVPEERLIDAMFRVNGLDPATGRMTAAQFDKGTDEIFGDRLAISPHLADYFAKSYGSTGPDGVATMTRDDMLKMFESGEFMIAPTGSRTFIPIQTRVDSSSPNYSKDSWWDTLFGNMSLARAEVIRQLAAMTGLSEEEVAKAFNDVGQNMSTMGQTLGHILQALIDGVVAGSSAAIGIIEKFAGTLLGLEGLSEQGAAMIQQAKEAALQGGNEAAISMLVMFMGMSPEEATAALNKSGGLQSVLSMSADDWLSMFDFESLFAAGNEYYLSNPDAPGRDLLSEDGEVELQGDALERFLSSPAGKDIRFDYALEYNGVKGDITFDPAKGTAWINGVQVRIFVTHPRTNADGTRSFDIRIRLLDETGGAHSFGKLGTDAGLIGVHDIIIPIVLDNGSGNGKVGDIKYQSSYGFVFEGDMDAEQIANLIKMVINNPSLAPMRKWLEDYFGASVESLLTVTTDLAGHEHVEVSQNVIGNWSGFVDKVGGRIDVEGGVAFTSTTQFNLSDNPWMLPALMVADFGMAYLAYGAASSAGLPPGTTHGAVDTTLALTDLAAEKFFKWEGSDVNWSFGVGAWFAGRGTWLANPAGEAPEGAQGPVYDWGGKGRVRFQFNWSHDFKSDAEPAASPNPAPPPPAS